MRESNLKRKIVIAWQFFEWFLAYIPLRTIFYFKKEYPRDEDIATRPLLIVSNHKHVFDPWFITLSLPFSQFRKILPIRFLATRNFKNPLFNIIYWVIIYPFMYWPNGVYVLPPRGKDAHLTIDEKTQEVREAMANHEALLFFAEGGLYKKEGVGEFKRGATYIQKETGASILPLAIRFKGVWWLPWPLGKRYISWSKQIIYIPKEMVNNEHIASARLREHVVFLYEKK